MTRTPAGPSRLARDYSRLAPTVFEQARLARLSAVVVGAGALGNEVIKNLALLGVGHLTIVDRDVVEASNLTRSVLFCTPDIADHIAARTPKAQFAAARVREINADTDVSAIVSEVADVGLGVLRRADVVFSCLDNEMARLELSWACTRVDRPLVDGGLGLINYSSGQVTLFPGADGPCYLCRKPAERRRQLLQELQGREDPCWLKARQQSQAGIVATTPLMASTVAALQVEIALRALIERPQPDAGASWRVTFHPQPALDASQFTRSPSCPLHDPASVIRETPIVGGSTSTCTVAAVLDRSGLSSPMIRLDWPLTGTAVCRACHHAWEPLIRRAAFRHAACPSCGGRDVVETMVLSSIGRDSPLAEQTLAALGQPARHIFEVVSEDDASRVVHVEHVDDGDRRGGTSC